ncbi:MAG: winged helix-turn-helix transcriptional regulator [Anaerolineales bacterium]|nr:winged helix-turn-helix transcriptional regulator [Anaerolineales bacterium]
MMENRKGTPLINWDLGTAYDFFISLNVLQNPETYGLRPSWAAGVRSRLPVEERKFLEETREFNYVSQNWVYSLPEPKDAATAIWSLRQIPPEKRIFEISEHHECEGLAEALLDVSKRRVYNQKDVDRVRDIIRKCEKSVKYKLVTKMLEWYSKPDEYGELFLSSIQSFYQNFYAEEEKRISPILKNNLKQSKELAGQVDVVELLKTLSQGVDFKEALEFPELVLVPSFWSTPLIMWAYKPEKYMVFVYGARPADMSLIPGEEAPDNTLHVLKALADPTRLQIMRYLSEENLTPAQLAKKLRLRAPTVIHHLDTLRIAGLVEITLDGSSKCYAARQEAINTTFLSLEKYLGKQ